jgi:DNA-directed RNA polymerase subunit RPC12/RpoP
MHKGGSLISKARKFTRETELSFVGRERGIICLSKTFFKSSTKYLWQCQKCKTQWRATHNNIKKGRGCPECAQARRIQASKKYGLPNLQQAAKRQGGLCKTKSYLGYHVKHEWICKKGHEWAAIPATVFRGTWCPYCDGQRLIDPIKDMAVLAKARGGRLLSKSYKNNKSALLFECHNKHKFKLIRTAFIKGQWCRYCASGIGEYAVRQVFEQLLKAPFPSCWPKWLKSPKGRALQLDGYNEKLKIAFEHQGDQHSRSVPFFESGFALDKRKTYDRIKKSTCKIMGIKLIEVPQVPTRVPFEELPRFIATELRKEGIVISRKEVEKVGIDLKTSHSERKIETLKAYAIKNGGKLLTSSYLGAFVKHKWRCSNGHEWLAIPANLLRKNYWCPKCGLRRRAKTRKIGSLEQLQKLAIKRGGSLVSKVYKGRSYQHKFKCGKCKRILNLSLREIEGYGGRNPRWCHGCSKLRIDSR